MDDDIRDRFRGARQARQTPASYGRTVPRLRAAPVASAPYQKPTTTTRPTAVRSEPTTPEPTPLVSSPSEPIPSQQYRSKKKGKKKMKVLFVVLILALVGSGGFFAYKKFVKKPALATNNINLKSSTPEAAQPKPSGKIRFVATGDNLAFESINNAAKKPDGSYDYVPLMDGLKPYFSKSDIRLCNESTPGGGEPLGISAFPSFNAPLAWSTGFAGVGCNLMNLGSDRTNDKGQAAIDAMLKTWDSQKNILAVAGANRSAEEQNKIRYFSVKGVKFAFLSYVASTKNPQTNTYGINLYTDALAKSQVAEARKGADLVIVSMNWGNENSSDISVDQDHIAQNLAAQNVDIIVGIGPHVLQPAKILSGTKGHQTLAWFSLGNFLNSQVPMENLIGGMAIMDIDVGTQQITEPKLLPFYMHYEWTAAQKKNQTQADLLARHNFALYPLDLAGDALAKSQNNTTVEAQTTRVRGIITKFIPIKVIKSTEF